MKEWLSALDQMFPEMIKWRRHLHMYPELSFHEEKTPEMIASILRDLGLEVRTKVGGRGVVAILKGDHPGKTVALRADFDALPIQDEKNVSYKSKVPGVMHACGHDAHTSILLGIASVLSRQKQKIKGTIIFIHQFAEEVSPGGALPMIEDGCLDGVDAIFGTHLWSGLPVGTIGYKEGYIMAAADCFDIYIHGKGGHGAMPHQTIDSIALGSQFIQHVQQLVSRRIDPIQSAVVTIGAFHAGETYNVIADQAHLKGTVRSFDESVRTQLEEEIGKLIQSTCEPFGATYTYEYERGYPAVWNHASETQWLAASASQVIDSKHVFQMEPNMGGEDFAYYLQKVPGTFFFTGAGNTELASFPHHHPRFDIDEQAILIAAKVMTVAALSYAAN